MKLVFTVADVAAALQVSPEEFLARRENLESHGFPKPLPGLESRWSIIDVVNWVNGSLRHLPGGRHPSWPALGSRLS